MTPWPLTTHTHSYMGGRGCPTRSICSTNSLNYSKRVFLPSKGAFTPELFFGPFYTGKSLFPNIVHFIGADLKTHHLKLIWSSPKKKNHTFGLSVLASDRSWWSVYSANCLTQTRSCCNCVILRRFGSHSKVQCECEPNYIYIYILCFKYALSGGIRTVQTTKSDDIWNICFHGSKMTKFVWHDFVVLLYIEM